MSKRYALLIGVNEYSDSKLPNLSTPVQDVEDLVSVLTDANIGGFSEVQPLKNITAQEARTSIVQFFQQPRKTTDLLLCYFSGHGVRDSLGMLYLAFADTRDRLYDANAIDATWLRNIINKTTSKKVILILDCCYSGSFDRGSKGEVGVGSSVGARPLFEGNGTGSIVLAASDSIQLAWEGGRFEGKVENSLFTRYLIEGMRTGEADKDDDGVISVDELFDYARDKVVAQTTKQVPVKWNYKYSGTLVIARNIKHSLAPLPKELEDALVSPYDWMVFGAVYELGRLLQSNDPPLQYTAHIRLKEIIEQRPGDIAQLAMNYLSTKSFAAMGAPKARQRVSDIRENQSTNKLTQGVKNRHFELLASFKPMQIPEILFLLVVTAIAPFAIILLVDLFISRLAKIFGFYSSYFLGGVFSLGSQIEMMTTVVGCLVWFSLNCIIYWWIGGIKGELSGLERVNLGLKYAYSGRFRVALMGMPINFLVYWLCVRITSTLFIAILSGQKEQPYHNYYEESADIFIATWTGLAFCFFLLSVWLVLRLYKAVENGDGKLT